MSRAMIAGAILGAAVVSGGVLMQGTVWRQAHANTGSPRLLEQVMARLREDYVDTISTDEMYRRAAAGFVREVDEPNGALLSPERYRRYREATSGRRAGVGLEVGMRDGFVTVITPLAGTPAESAGIAPGEHIVAVNGTPTFGLTLEEVQAALDGPAGSTVRLTLERGLENPDLALTRRDIERRPVTRTGLANGVGYVALGMFGDRTPADVRGVVDSLRGRGARSLILDLRRNAGGTLEQGVVAAELFLDAGQGIARTRGRVATSDRDIRDAAPQAWPGMPVVVLVDSGSASAAEVLAGALQDNGRAVLVGSRTYGKGSDQSIFPVSGGYALRLTTSRWLTPKGRKIEHDSADGGGGLEPDIVVDAPAVTGAADPVIRGAMELLAGVTTTEALRARVRRRSSARRP